MTALAVQPTDTRKAHETALIALASEANQDPDLLDDPAFQARLGALTHPTMTGETRDEAFEDLMGQVDTLDGVAIGTVPWYDIEPELNCPDRDAEAYQIQEQVVADAVDLLLNGK